MIENTEAQARLHPDLVSAEAHQVIELAQAHGALGCKVNGAGGDGGSLTLLMGAESDQKRALVSALEVANSLFQPIPICLSRFGYAYGIRLDTMGRLAYFEFLVKFYII